MELIDYSTNSAGVDFSQSNFDALRTQPEELGALLVDRPCNLERCEKDSSLRKCKAEAFVPEHLRRKRMSRVCSFYRQACFNPIYFAWLVLTDILVPHSRQFTGSLFRCMSGCVHAIRNNLS